MHNKIISTGFALMFGMLLIACDRIRPNGKYRAAATQKYDQTPPTTTPTTNKQSSDIGSEPPGPAVKINSLWVDGDRVDFSTTKIIHTNKNGTTRLFKEGESLSLDESLQISL